MTSIDLAAVVFFGVLCFTFGLLQRPSARRSALPLAFSPARSAGTR